MPIISFSFLIFYIFSVLAFYVVPNRFRWIVLIAASYIFYASFRWQYLLILISITVIVYFGAIKISTESTVKKRRASLAVSILLILIILISFKYSNFLIPDFNVLMCNFDLNFSIDSPNIIVPVGISFFTLQSIGYLIDVFRAEHIPERHYGIVSAYVSFFPLLLAGPIERSATLLPQFRNNRIFDPLDLREGLTLMLFGFFKKLVIADQLAIYVNQVFSAPAQYQGTALLLGVYFFAFQIYFDFSAYTDIARGAARTIGFRVRENFDHPYFSRSFREFWHKWHMSLSTWFRDYVYIPLGGNRVKELRWNINIFVVFALSGLWHGAGFTFILWGILHGFFLSASRYISRAGKYLFVRAEKERTPFLYQYIKVFLVFNFVCFAWILFKSENIHEAFNIIKNVFVYKSNYDLSSLFSKELGVALIAFFVLEIFLFINRDKNESLPFRFWIRWGIVYLLLFAIILFGVVSNQFIYSGF